MTKRIVFRTAAMRDLSQLGEESEARWGRKRTRQYLDAIEAKIQKLAENPMLGHDAELPRAGLRRIDSGRHTIFHMVFEDRIEIVRVRHVASDFERWV